MHTMPAPAAPQMTVDEYLALPVPELGRIELVDGELVVMSDPPLAHQDVVVSLIVALRTWCRAAPGRGRATINIDTRLDDHNVLQPDAQWFAHGRTLNDPTRRPQPLGDIVVEVRSPSTWHRDVGRKRTLYEQHGARELWLIDPTTQTVIILSRSSSDGALFDTSSERGNGDQLTSPLLPDFSIDVAELFA